MDNQLISRRVDWAATTNIYEVNTRQYTAEGTFQAFAKHLPRLKDMGVHTLWFMPITPIAQKNKKGTLGSPYACSDYTAINPEFGTIEDFRQLVQHAHELCFKVIIDWVANHTGWDHRWTTEHPEYYLKDSSTNDFKAASGMDDIIELDYNNPALRAAMVDAMRYWVRETGIDGYRCDLASWVQLDFWEEARPLVDEGKTLFWLGEFDELDHPGYGKVFDASYSWKWMHQTEDFYKNHLSFSVLDNLLAQYSAIGDGSMRAWFTSNHDENSWNGTEYEKYGNMARALAVFSATWNGVPLIYSGQEIPLKGKRLQFFEKDEINWPGTFELHNFYKTLLHLHAGNSALRGGDPAVQTHRPATNHDTKALVYLRKNGEEEVLVLLNMSHDALYLQTNDQFIRGTFRNVFTGEEHEFSGMKSFEMKPWEYLLFEKIV